MSLPRKLTLKDISLAEGTTSIATTPVPAIIVTPVSGYLIKLAAAAGGTTTGTIAVAVTVNNGADVTGGNLTIAAGTNARNGAILELPKTGPNAIYVNEGDAIIFTPSGGTGASIPGGFTATIRPQ